MAVTKHKNAFYAALEHQYGKKSLGEAKKILSIDEIDGRWSREKAASKFMQGSANIDPLRNFAQASVYGGWDALHELLRLRKEKAHNENEVGSFSLYEYWTFAPFWAASRSEKAPQEVRDLASSWVRAWIGHAVLSSIGWTPNRVEWVYQGKNVGPALLDGDWPKVPPYVFPAGARNIFSKPAEGRGGWFIQQPSTSLLHWILNVPGRRTNARARREMKDLYDKEGQMFSHNAIQIATGYLYAQHVPASVFSISEEERAGCLEYIRTNGASRIKTVVDLIGDWPQLVDVYTFRANGRYVQILEKDTAGTKPAIMLVDANQDLGRVVLHTPVEYSSSRHTRATGALVANGDFLQGETTGEGKTTRTEPVKASESDVYRWGRDGLHVEGYNPPPSDPDDDPDDDDQGEPGEDRIDRLERELKELWEKVGDLDLDELKGQISEVDERLGKLLEKVLEVIEKAEQIDKLRKILEKIL